MMALANSDPRPMLMVVGGLPEDNDEGGDDELDDDEKANAGAEVRRPSAESAL